MPKKELSSPTKKLADSVQNSKKVGELLSPRNQLCLMSDDEETINK